eukprot:UN00572
MSAVVLRLPLYVKTGIRTFTFASQHRPLITGIATTTGIAIFGDISCQYIAHKHSSRRNYTFQWDYKRTVTFGLTGFLFAPQMVLWYRYIQHKIPGQSMKTASKRVIMDQCVFASWTTVYFLSFNTYLQGGNCGDIKKQVNTKWMDTYIANTLLWPPFQFINFWLIPPHFRVLGTNLVSLAWSAYLSFKVNQ